MNERIFTNARVVLDHEVLARGTVRVVDGRIAAIDSGASSLPAALDLQGDWLLPGLVEVHTDNLERHVMPRPKVSFPMRAAVQSHDAEVATWLADLPALTLPLWHEIQLPVCALEWLNLTPVK